MPARWLARPRRRRRQDADRPEAWTGWQITAAKDHRHPGVHHRRHLNPMQYTIKLVDTQTNVAVSDYSNPCSSWKSATWETRR
jgi:hypothetical protein